MRCLPAALLALPLPLAAATYEVGPGQTYTTLAAVPSLAPGDVVEISGGPYHEVRRWTQAGTAANPITIRGVGTPRPVIDADGLDVSGSLPNPRAVFQIEASYVVVEHLDFRNARNGDNGSAVRVTTFGAAPTGVVIRDCHLHDCDMGFMNGPCDYARVEACEIDHNGTAAYSGYSHNFYIGGNATTVTGCYIHDSLYGQNVKSRAHYTELLYNWIADSQDGEVGFVDETDTATADSNALLLGNVIVSKPRGSGWNSTRFIMFGSDSGAAHTGTMWVINNTCIAGTTNINFLWTDRAEAGIVASNNVFVGSDHISDSDTGPVSGDRNWMVSTASAPGTFTNSVTGSSPGFVDAANRDYHLTSGSPCRGIGTNAPTYHDGSGTQHSAMPTLEYSALGSLTARASDGALDAGAYEYGVGGTTAGGSTTSGATSSGTTGGTSAGGPSGPPVSGAANGGSGGCGLGAGLGLGLVLLTLIRRHR